MTPGAEPDARAPRGGGATRRRSGWPLVAAGLVVLVGLGLIAHQVGRRWSRARRIAAVAGGDIELGLAAARSGDPELLRSAVPQLIEAGAVPDIGDIWLRQVAEVVDEPAALALYHAAMRNGARVGALHAAEAPAVAFHGVRDREGTASLMESAEREPARYITMLNAHAGWLAVDFGRPRVLALLASLLGDATRIEVIWFQQPDQRVWEDVYGLRAADLAVLLMARIAGRSYDGYVPRTREELLDPAARARAVAEMKRWWKRSGPEPALEPAGWVVFEGRGHVIDPMRGRRFAELGAPEDPVGRRAWESSHRRATDSLRILYGPVPVGALQLQVGDWIEPGGPATRRDRVVEVTAEPEKVTVVELDLDADDEDD